MPFFSSSAALIAFCVIEHGLEQGFFDFAQHQVIQLARLVAVERFEI